MTFMEVKFNIEPIEPARDILMAELSELGYDSFEEDEDGLKAYIEKERFDSTKIRSLYVLNDRHFKISFDSSELPDTNWNAEWEKSYAPIDIDSKILVRALFHPPSDHHEYDILIDPRMSFGTGHHSTTRLMLRNALQKDLEDKTVLDMGCGTAVIAIFCKMCGAKDVLAMDIDENCVRNSMENCIMNHVEIDVQKGEAHSLNGLQFDIIFANINRNVLLEDMVRYTDSLNDNGTLVISGFYEQDIKVLREKARSCGMEFINKAQELEWCALEFVKR